jgi:hypothetical protein
MTPKVFLLTLFSDDEEEDTKTILIRDVANFSEHEDPQLRGSIVLLLGQVLKGALVECGGDLDMWYNGRRPNHRDTLNIFQNLLGDELVSAITTKHILTGALTFLPSFLGSIHSRFSISLLKDLLNIPNSSAYKYWLVKVELCKILGQLPYIAMQYIVPQQPLQALAIEILINNLGDEDVKVREESARALVSAKFFWPQDGDKCTVTCGASKMASDLVMPIIGDGGKDGNFEVENSTQCSHRRLLFMLQTQLMTSKSSTMTLGLVEALLRLCEISSNCNSTKGSVTSDLCLKLAEFRVEEKRENVQWKLKWV